MSICFIINFTSSLQIWIAFRIRKKLAFFSKFSQNSFRWNSIADYRFLPTNLFCSFLENLFASLYAWVTRLGYFSVKNAGSLPDPSTFFKLDVSSFSFKPVRTELFGILIGKFSRIVDSLPTTKRTHVQHPRWIRINPIKKHPRSPETPRGVSWWWRKTEREVDGTIFFFTENLSKFVDINCLLLYCRGAFLTARITYRSMPLSRMIPGHLRWYAFDTRLT